MDAPNAPYGMAPRPKRPRLVRAATATNGATNDVAIGNSGGLHEGVTYRISHAIGGRAERRVIRSVAVYAGMVQRRGWAGQTVACLEFALPQGRNLLLLPGQLVDARPTALNGQGQWVLRDDDTSHRRRASRRTRS